MPSLSCLQSPVSGLTLRAWGTACQPPVKYFLVSFTDLFGVQRSKLVRFGEAAKAHRCYSVRAPREPAPASPPP